MYQWKIYEMRKSLRSFSTFCAIGELTGMCNNCNTLFLRILCSENKEKMRKTWMLSGVRCCQLSLTGSLHTTCGEPMSQGALNDSLWVSRCLIMKIWVWKMNEYTILSTLVLFCCLWFEVFGGTIWISVWIDGNSIQLGFMHSCVQEHQKLLRALVNCCVVEA